MRIFSFCNLQSMNGSIGPNTLKQTSGQKSTQLHQFCHREKHEPHVPSTSGNQGIRKIRSEPCGEEHHEWALSKSHKSAREIVQAVLQQIKGRKERQGGEFLEAEQVDHPPLSLLWLRFNSWPGNFHELWTDQKKRKKKCWPGAIQRVCKAMSCKNYYHIEDPFVQISYQQAVLLHLLLLICLFE